MHNNCIKSEDFVKKTFGGEQIRDNRCNTKSGKTLHIALCIVVKYIHEKQDNKNINYFIAYIAYYKIETFFKCIAQLFNEVATYDR